jgi:PKD domain-containing protein/carbohydrate binding protein with CBM4/9 domain/putative Ig domain-containing protein
VTPSTGNEPLAVTADGSRSNDSDGAVVFYQFDFGDGTTPVSQTSPTASHAYAAGNWTATVTVTDNHGATGSGSVPVIVAAVPSQPNLVTNPSFEANDLTHWNAFASCAIARVSGGFDGAYAVEVTATGTPTASFGLNDSPDWVGSTTSAGIVYRYTAWVRSATSTGTARIQVKEYSRGGVLLGSALSAGVRLSPTWQQVTVDYTTAAFNSTLDFQVKDSPVAAGEIFRVDNVSIRNMTASPLPGGDHAPVVTAPATASVYAGLRTTVTVMAADADGDAITSLTASRLPAGATFTPNPGNTTGTLAWTPTLAQAGAFVGTYSVTFTASNALSGSSSTLIAVAADQFYPNPFRFDAVLSFATSRPGRLRVEIFDVRGRRVRELVNEANHPAGLLQLRVDGLDPDGRKLAAGLYFYRIDTPEGVRRGRFVVLR